MIRSKTSGWLLAMATATVLFAPACSPAAQPPDAGLPGTTAPSTTASGTGAPTGTGQPGDSLVGSWLSPSCGERTYRRELELAADGKFRSADLVAPCPPNVVCVWSGIVNREGTYTVAGGKLTLTVTVDGGPQGTPLPGSFGIDPTTGAPFETDSSGKVCAYTRSPKG